MEYGCASGESDVRWCINTLDGIGGSSSNGHGWYSYLRSSTSTFGGMTVSSGLLKMPTMRFCWMENCKISDTEDR